MPFFFAPRRIVRQVADFPRARQLMLRGRCSKGLDEGAHEVPVRREGLFGRHHQALVEPTVGIEPGEVTDVPGDEDSPVLPCDVEQCFVR
jgi:hypothetical protein